MNNNNHDYNTEDWNDNPTNTENHEHSFKQLFAGAVDWRHYLPSGSFDEYRDSPAHLRAIGERIIDLYRASFEEDHGAWQDETPERRKAQRPIDIADSRLAEVMAFGSEWES